MNKNDVLQKYSTTELFNMPLSELSAIDDQVYKYWHKVRATIAYKESLDKENPPAVEE